MSRRRWCIFAAFTLALGAAIFVPATQLTATTSGNTQGQTEPDEDWRWRHGQPRHWRACFMQN